MEERKKTDTLTLKKRMQRENKRTGETLSKNKTKTKRSNKRIKQTRNIGTMCGQLWVL